MIKHIDKPGKNTRVKQLKKNYKRGAGDIQLEIWRKSNWHVVDRLYLVISIISKQGQYLATSQISKNNWPLNNNNFESFVTDLAWLKVHGPQVSDDSHSQRPTDNIDGNFMVGRINLDYLNYLNLSYTARDVFQQQVLTQNVVRDV